MLSHRRGRSLSEALTLEQLEEGGVVISGITNRTSANQGLREGDEIVGATINFDHLSRDEVLKVLKLMAPFDDKVQVLMKNKRSKSLDHLDQYSRNSGTTLENPYNKLYNAKIKKYMTDGSHGAEGGHVNGEATTNPKSRLGRKQDTDLPRLGVDFGVLKTNTPRHDAFDDSQMDDVTFSADGNLMDGMNMNLPPLGSSSVGPSRVQVPSLNVDSTKSQLKSPDRRRSRTLPESPDVNTTAGLQLSQPESPSANLDGPQIGLETNGTYNAQDINVGLPKSDLQRPGIPDMGLNVNRGKLSGPTFGPDLNGPEFEVRTPDVDMSDISLAKKSLKHSSKLKNPDLNVDQLSSYVESPTVEVSERSSDIRVEMPNMNVSGPHVDLPHVKRPQFNLSGPDTDMFSGDIQFYKSKTGLKAPDFDVGVPSGKVKMPKSGLSGKGKVSIEKPDVRMKTSKIKGDLHAPSVTQTKAELKAPDLDINAHAVYMKSPLGKYKAPKFRMPQFEFPGINVPDIDGDLEGPDLDPSAPNFEENIHFPRRDYTAPNLDLNPPGMDINLPSGSLNFDADAPTGKGKMPKLKLFGTLPQKKGVDINADVKTPDLSLKSPNIGGKDSLYMNVGDMDLKTQNIDMNAPDIHAGMPSGKLNKFNLLGSKGPNLDLNTHFKSPGVDLSGPNLSGINAPDLNMPKADFKSPKLDLNTPNFKLKMPKADLQGPDWDDDVPSGKLKIPRFNLSGTLPKGSNMDVNADLTSPDLSMKGPKINGGLDSPDWDLPKMDLKAPKLDINTPDVATGSPKLTMKMPKLKMPDFSSPSIKGPEIEGPDVNFNSPTVNVKGPNTDFRMPNISGPSGNFKKPNLNLLDMDLAAPKEEGPNLDLNLPKLHATGVNLSGGINAPDLKMPKVDFKSPKLDLSSPDVDLNMPSGKMKMPKVAVPKASLHSPDWDVDVPAGKLKVPKVNLSGTLPKAPNLNINTDLKSPDLSLKGPKVNAGLESPDLKFPNMDIKSPKLDVNTPDVNIGSPKSKFKFPKLKMPKFSLPGMKGPDGNLDGPSVDLNAPNVKMKGPNADFRMPDVDVGGPSGKLKKTNFNFPDFGFSGPKLDGPNLDLKSPDLDIAGPNLSGGIKAPELNIPKADFKSPKFPDLDVSGPSGKLNMPKLNLSGTMPDGPNMDMNTDMNFPNFPSLKGRIGSPDYDLPNADLKAPKLDINTPDVKIGSPKTKFKKPKLKMPKFNLPGITGPDGNLDGPDFDINGPNVNIKSPKADFRMPDVDVAAPSVKVKKPNLNLPDWGVSGPKLSGPNLDLKSPDLNITGPNLSSGISAPDLNMPNVDLSMPKLPHLKSPKLDLSTPNANLDMPSLSKPRVDLHGPEWDADVPSGKLKMPKLNVSGTLPKPDLNSPDLNLKIPKLKADTYSPDMNLPNMDLKAPALKMNTPDANIGSPKSKFKFPKLKMPKVNFPSLKGPDFDGNLGDPNINISAPNVNLQGPKAGLETPDVDLRSTTGKLKKPHLKVPDVEFSGPKLNGPNFKSPDFDTKLPKGPGLNMNSDFSTPDFSVKAPKIKGGINAPNLGLPSTDLNAPEFNVKTPDWNIGSPDANFKKPKMKKPKADISGPKGPNINIDGDLQGPDLNLPNTGIRGPNGKLKMSNLNMPDLSLSGPSAKRPDMNLSTSKFKAPVVNMPNLNLPDANLKQPKLDVGAKQPDFGINGNIGGYTGMNVPSGSIQGPQTELDLADKEFKLPSLTMPQFGSPDYDKVASDIDFGAHLRKDNLGIFPPNAKMNVKPTELKGTVAGPQGSSPNVDLNMPKVKNPKLSFKAPELDVDNLSADYHGHAYKTRAFDITGENIKVPVLDIDRDVLPRPNDRKSTKTRIRSSYPLLDGDLDHTDVHHPDLNIDDFTGKDHVLRARGSKLDLQASGNYRQVISSPDLNLNLRDQKPNRKIAAGDGEVKATHQRRAQTHINAHLPHSSQTSRLKVPDDTDGYLVTIFPTQKTPQKTSRKYNTLGGLDFHPSNLELEVPGDNDLKGSTFFFSNLI
ncbi:neuroblast differentiation-associated protein AHNAK [Thalassophryne amazonica]|uniref:neuroblast differentiation-associated protein AHNAK n=1 Tax=Thalassophryne amazonica TaxID=390379 RepID=UPI0014719AFE|nr:neuroblast differentiation-associated protein AHNAK [Thalassophryne amazonica]XP_034043774.1 neuroblast differentiation-associated protein AHNAK [Thalassophryne amazonica]XP_034043775.1 neuroblast differentiation-associated protein AHNAK [Thalassophryne amazonica]